MPRLILLAIALVALAVATFSLISLLRRQTIFTTLELVGAGFVMVVVVAHVFERFRLFPLMGWGLPNSAGHYLDLVSAIAGLTLLPIGFLLDRFHIRTSRDLIKGRRPW